MQVLLQSNSTGWGGGRIAVGRLGRGAVGRLGRGAVGRLGRGPLGSHLRAGKTLKQKKKRNGVTMSCITKIYADSGTDVMLRVEGILSSSLKVLSQRH